MSMVKCKKHDDSTASVKIYANGGWCFGGCGFIPLEELGLTGEDVKYEKPYYESLIDRHDYISTLPVGDFRGFQFPFDAKGFYITWPDSFYFKQRLFDPNNKGRYKGPSGHKAPPFWARKVGYKTLLIVEGELESLSAAAAVSNMDVVSPGGASNFTNSTNLTTYLNYSRIIIAVDNDGPGVTAGRELGSLLLYRVPYLSIIHKSVSKDFNDILTQDGKETLQNYILTKVQESVPWSNTRPGKGEVL